MHTRRAGKREHLAAGTAAQAIEVFLWTGPMPITNPSFTQPALPAKIPRNAISISAPVSGKPTLAYSAMQLPVDPETT